MSGTKTCFLKVCFYEEWVTMGTLFVEIKKYVGMREDKNVVVALNMIGNETALCIRLEQLFKNYWNIETGAYTSNKNIFEEFDVHVVFELSYSGENKAKIHKIGEYILFLKYIHDVIQRTGKSTRSSFNSELLILSETLDDLIENGWHLRYLAVPNAKEKWAQMQKLKDEEDEKEEEE
jgi:hypothetical protein